MQSMVDYDLGIRNGIGCLVPREYPNWYGIPTIGFIWYNNVTDPYIEYNGKQVNSIIVEETMWSWFREEYPKGTRMMFEEYMQANVDDIIELIERLVVA